MKKKILAALPPVLGLALLASLATWGFLAARPGPELLQGEVEATKVDVAAKVPGRIATLLVREGEVVRRGDPVATLASPEIEARVGQAEAARTGAEALNEKADRGAREEEIRAARSTWERARHATELAEKTAGRLERLARDGVVPQQRRDEAEAQWKTARAAEEAARAAFDMVTAGARREDKAAAKAQVARADSAVAEARSYLDETKVAAPASGEVYRRNVEPGELVAPGFPIVTLVDLSDSWVVFQLREDRLAGFRMGDRFTAKVPALGNAAVDLRVSYIAPQGDFATWRATSSQGGFDLKTFELRARPVAPVAGLRPGMSVLLPWTASR